MERSFPPLGSIRSEAERREAQAYLERGAAIADAFESLARFVQRVRQSLAPHLTVPHR
jgi:hypothetical protein